MNFIKEHKKTIINLAFILVVILMVWEVENQKYLASNNTIAYLEENEEFVMPVVKREDQEEVKESIEQTKNSNISVKETTTLIDYTVEESPVTYTEENQEEMVEGIVLEIDDQKLNVKNEKILEETANKIVNILIPDEKVRENYLLTGEIKDYQINGKTITSISIENDISYQEALIPKSQMITTSEELMFYLFHKGLDYEQKTNYIVKENQGFEQVKKVNNITNREFLINNPEYKGVPLLKSGDEIVTNKIDPLLNIAVYYEYSKEQVLKYDTIKKETDDLDKGEKEVEQEGKNGKFLVTYKAKYVNGEVVSEEQISSKQLEKVINKIVLIGTHEEEEKEDIEDTINEVIEVITPSVDTTTGDTTASSDSNVGGFIWPMSSRSIMCGFGCYYGHNGMDIDGGYGSPIYAAKSGTVATAGWSPYGGGNEVTINHGGGLYTVYSHMKQAPNVSPGQSVSQGQVIGYEGGTGNVTAPHLHFEIRTGSSGGAFSGTPQNPLNYLP